ncbi:hypothetical protein BKA93DRAFT_192089 [Sparassis latifolia]
MACSRFVRFVACHSKDVGSYISHRPRSFRLKSTGDPDDRQCIAEPSKVVVSTQALTERVNVSPPVYDDRPSDSPPSRRACTLFPPEIWSAIFSALQGDALENKPNLMTTWQNLTLTCQAFRQLVQPFLFASFVFPATCVSWNGSERRTRALDPDSHARTMERLAFVNQERIARGVKTCHVVPRYLRPLFLRDDCQDSEKEELILGTFFSSLLPSLPKLQHVELARIALRPSHLRALSQPGLPVWLSIHFNACSLWEAEQSLDSSVRGGKIVIAPIPVRHLSVTVDSCSSLVTTYLPLPHMEHTDFATYQIHNYLFEAIILERLSAAQSFLVLRSLEIIFEPFCSRCDWRPFLASHCSSLTRLSLINVYAGLLLLPLPSFACTLPSLKFFRGSWSGAKLFAEDQPALRHLVIRDWRDMIVLEESEALARFGELREVFRQVVSLEIHVVGYTKQLLEQLCNSPNLRALKLDGIPGRGHDDLLSALSALRALPLSPNMEYLSIPTEDYASGAIAGWGRRRQELLKSMIGAVSPLLRERCPRLRYVELRFLATAGHSSARIAFDPRVDRSKWENLQNIEEWRDADGQL